MRDVIAEVYGLRPRGQVEGITVLVVSTTDPDIRDAVAGLLVQRQGRRPGRILHVEQLDTAEWEVTVEDRGPLPTHRRNPSGNGVLIGA